MTERAGIARIERGDADFEAAIADGSFTGRLPSARPDMLEFPATEADTAEVVRRAARDGRRVAIRSGGHSWSSASVRDGGVLLDLGRLDSVAIDAAARTARIGPGVRGGRLGAALVQAGRAFPVGHCGTPGVGGYLTGGGLGLNWGEWGPACYSVRSMRLVTAEGEIVEASAERDADLFWLARGAGPALPAVVTSFELELRDLPRDVRVAGWTHSLADVGAVAEWIEEASTALPRSVELPVVLAGPGRPGADPGAPHVVGTTAIAYSASPDASARALAPLGSGPGVRPLAVLEPAPVPFDSLHTPVDLTYPEGARYLVDTFWTPRGLGEVLPLLAPLIERAPSGRSYVLASMPAHGAGTSLVEEGRAAYSMHDRSIVIVYTIWDDSRDDAANAAWLDDVAGALEPIASGHFLSEADIRRRPDRVAASFSAPSWARIERLRRRVDPTGVFHAFPA